MRHLRQSELSLFSHSGERKYLNAAELRRFLKIARRSAAEVRLFCEVLARTGARISEALALSPVAIDLDVGAVNIATMKRRRRGIVRQIPIPRTLIADLDRHFHIRVRQQDERLAIARLWRWSRTTAWRRIKRMMAVAKIDGTRACPKGLRHSFGVSAFQAQVPPHLVQRWLGHASLRTTSIYADVMGPDERGFAKRMWK